MNIRHFIQQKKGFAMLFTVLIVTLILSIALGISNITYKQTILSSLAKDSEIALYQADAGAECALYYDLNVNKRWFDGIKTPAPTMTCGNQTLAFDSTKSETNYYVYASPATGGACISMIEIDKRAAAPSPVVITAHGNNICQPNPRQVERALQVSYIP